MNIYEQLATLPYLSAYQQLIQSTIELDVFSNLARPITTKELSEKMNWDEGLSSPRLVLQAGFIDFYDVLVRQSNERVFQVTAGVGMRRHLFKVFVRDPQLAQRHRDSGRAEIGFERVDSGHREILLVLPSQFHDVPREADEPRRRRSVFFQDMAHPARRQDRQSDPMGNIVVSG